MENFDGQEIVFDDASDSRFAAKLVKRLKKEADAEIVGLHVKHTARRGARCVPLDASGRAQALRFETVEQSLAA
ncbi:hypothetical protein [Paraburkholderia kirstenboschensis]|uniref:Uncharacterized protein n=1 Tax=Paraburkholderia kirstenboschensis TaxID=1245436 RepID=A0ABZ0ECC7_9BURK|nr:hypothetical protein [Paraburkholderia kirstenboschensis]WOD14862.1 hypothetical protein RW095_16075 [Paraburkholderia kirstenboschensis]